MGFDYESGAASGKSSGQQGKEGQSVQKGRERCWGKGAVRPSGE